MCTNCLRQKDSKLDKDSSARTGRQWRAVSENGERLREPLERAVAKVPVARRQREWGALARTLGTSRRLINLVQPVFIFRRASGYNLKKPVLKHSGYRSTFAATDNTVVNRPDRRNLGGGAGEKHLVS